MLQPRSCTGRKRAVPALSESPTSKARWAPGVAPATWASARKTSNALTARSRIGVGLFPGCRAPTRLRAPLDRHLAPLGGREARDGGVRVGRVAALQERLFDRRREPRRIGGRRAGGG